jgi:hypothetical protein
LLLLLLLLLLSGVIDAVMIFLASPMWLTILRRDAEA